MTIGPHLKNPRLHTSRISRIVQTSCLLFLWLALAGCGGRTPSGAGDLTIRLAPPSEGDDAGYLTVQLADASGAPVTEATVQLEGNMNHAGMAPVLSVAVTDNADGSTDGAYHIPFSFTMLGDWIITVSAERAGKAKSTQNFNVTVSDGKVEVTGP